MHAWLCENPIGVDALQWKELPTPQPKAGEVLVEIKAASLNFPDLLIVQNKYQFKPALPFVPGSEYAGVVEAVGEGVSHLTVGQNVACLSGTGGFGTHTLAPAASDPRVIWVPAGGRSGFPTSSPGPPAAAHSLADALVPQAEQARISLAFAGVPQGFAPHEGHASAPLATAALKFAASSFPWSFLNMIEAEVHPNRASKVEQELLR